jgi:hypothetical protein
MCSASTSQVTSNSRSPLSRESPSTLQDSPAGVTFHANSRSQKQRLKRFLNRRKANKTKGHRASGRELFAPEHLRPLHLYLVQPPIPGSIHPAFVKNSFYRIRRNLPNPRKCPETGALRRIRPKSPKSTKCSKMPINKGPHEEQRQSPAAHTGRLQVNLAPLL